MARTSQHTRPRAWGLVAVVVLVAAAVRLSPPPPPAAAEVMHGAGFDATVAGWTSWYGNYAIGDVGAVWCIDHGVRAPDEAFGYEPTTVDDQPQTIRTALAWLVTTNATLAASDPVESAATMLAGHDLVGANYPGGLLDVDALTVDALSGFDGAEARVLARAQELKRDALAHSALLAPYVLSLSVTPVDPGASESVVVQLTDANGVPMPAVPVAVAANGASLGGITTVVTGLDGRASTPFTAVEGPNWFFAHATPPDLELHALASTTIAAQRVAVPATIAVAAQTGYVAVTPPGTLRVRKTGDALPYFPIAGAGFTITDASGTTVATTAVDESGAAPPVTLAPGTYLVTETSPPPWYDAAGPWTVTINAGAETVLEVHDLVRRGGARIAKVDAMTHQTVAGAVLHLRHDADHDGEYEHALPPITTTLEPTAVDALVPGAYELVEIEAPTGYVRAIDPIRFSVRPGDTVFVPFMNQPVPTTTTTTTTSTTTTTVAAAPPITTRALPRTGLPIIDLVLAGSGLVIVGAALRRAQRMLPVWPSE